MMAALQNIIKSDWFIVFVLLYWHAFANEIISFFFFFYKWLIDLFEYTFYFANPVGWGQGL